MAHYSEFESGHVRTRIITPKPSQAGTIVVDTVRPYDISVRSGPRPLFLRRVSSLDREDFLQETTHPHEALVLRPRRPQYIRRASSLDGDDVRAPIRERRRFHEDESHLGPSNSGAIVRTRTQYYPSPGSDGEDEEDEIDAIRARSQYGQARRRELQRRRRYGRPDFRNEDMDDSRSSIASGPRRSASADGRQERRRPTGRRRNKSQRDGSSSSSSDLGCTSDDEKQKKKLKWKKWGAIGLASVATIHAVHGVYETVEKTQSRRKELSEGKIDEEQAKKMKNKQRFRNAADVGVAAVWIKSAYDEIKEYQEARKEHAEWLEKSEERHKQRLERAKAHDRVGGHQGDRD